MEQAPGMTGTLITVNNVQERRWKGRRRRGKGSRSSSCHVNGTLTSPWTWFPAPFSAPATPTTSTTTPDSVSNSPHPPPASLPAPPSAWPRPPPDGQSAPQGMAGAYRTFA
eukprot:764814-Hanusia_phi.AAC.6